MDEADLTGSSVTVKSGATINSIDSAINDYTANITLQTGALIKGDIDYESGTADTYAAEEGASVSYKLANALGTATQYGGDKLIQVVSDGATVNKDE